MIEWEYKFKLLKSYEVVLEQFRREFGEPLVEHQVDIYYQHPSRDFAKTDEALRLRSVNGVAELTYKGPKISRQSKSREELTVKVNDLTTADLILKRLGFVEVARIEKTRYNFRHNNFTISVDSVKDVGDFVEVEGLNVSEKDLLDYVNWLKSKYDFLGEGVTKSYLELYLERRVK